MNCSALTNDMPVDFHGHDQGHDEWIESDSGIIRLSFKTKTKLFFK